jgi:hypothetical protein
MEQKFWGLLNARRDGVEHFGRISNINHADHGNISRLEHLALDRMEAKHLRWRAELSQGGPLSLYRIGTGILH